MNENYRELLEAELSRFDKMLDGEALVRWGAGLYDKESGGFYYSGSARDNEQFKPDIESTSQMISLLSSLGLFKYSDGDERFPAWFKDGLINYFRVRQDEETGFFFDIQFGKAVNESKKGRNLGQATARLRELGSSPLYLTPSERLLLDCEKKNDVLPEHYASLDKYRAWLDDFEWDSDDGHKQYFAANMLAASSESIKAAGYLNYTRDYITDIQNKETGLWGKKCDSMAMNAAMKISFLYDSEYKYPNVERMISSIGKIVESEEPYSVSTLWNPLVLVRNVIRWYGDIPKELEEKINECKLPLIKTCIDRIERFKKPDGGFSYYPNQSCRTSQGVVVSLGLDDESDVNGTMLSTASMRDTMRIIVGGAGKPLIPQYNSLFFNLIGKEK